MVFVASSSPQIAPTIDATPITRQSANPARVVIRWVLPNRAFSPVLLASELSTRSRWAAVGPRELKPVTVEYT